ncbi:glycosyltransferase [Flavobacterium galactosidilyticum]|uniref:glycosyltransferase family 2 protein n=1 Tax=Flavobacterium galactosidilyticum TaxID=2893886 RepID=UPI001E4BDACC|nr:glycosyltransferase [Flavobacterium sp. F-340]UFH47407.1 glycosyltransferase [Flavobacterium sp. F-340]
MPQTTVLIPTYNCAKYIVPAIKSVLAQKYADYELLIIDDGSTDTTEEIVSKISDSRIVYLKNSCNKGIVYTLNKGIEMAKGEYIARMDADDIVLGNRLQAQTDFLTKNPDYGIVGGWYQVTNENGKIIDTVEGVTDYGSAQLGLLFRNQFTHSAVTMRTDLAKQLKYDPEFQYCEDYDLWVRFAEVSKVANLPAYYLSYRWYSENSCNRKQKELKQAILNLLSRELDKIEVEHTAEELMLHAGVCFGMAPKLFKNEEKINGLNQWYDKVFASEVLIQRYDEEWLLDFRKNILGKYCGIY